MTSLEARMTQTTGISRAGAPGSAYGALILGIIAVALFTLPPAPIVVGAVGSPRRYMRGAFCVASGPARAPCPHLWVQSSASSG